MRALVIGAGAIGRVFGHHLALGGAHVGFVVRPRQVAEARAGFAMYPLNRPARDRTSPVFLRPHAVFDDQDAALAEPWDLIVLATSSVALRSGDWLARLGRGLGDARVLALQAGPEDPALVFSHVPQERGAWGMLSVVSFQAPLPGDTLPQPGVAYWFPWMSRLAFSGPDDVVAMVTGALARGGMPVRRVDSVQTQVAFVGAVLDKTVIALECAGWSFTALRRDRVLLPLAVAAMRESWALAERTTGCRTPWSLRLLRPSHLRAALLAAPRLLPFDIERFFAFHYRKVADQTRLMIDTQLRRSADARIPTPATRALSERLDAARGHA